MKDNLFKGITRNVFLLGITSLFTDLSSQMVFPLIPLFLTGVLGAGAYAVGIVEGAAEMTASLLKVLSGYWSDKIRRRKPFVLLGYSISSFVKPLFALANIWTFVLMVRVVERMGKGLRNAPRDAIVAESCDERYRGRAYGFHRAMDGIGSVLGALLAFFLLPILGYRRIFLLALLPGIISVFVILFIRERAAPTGNEPEKISVKSGFRELPGNLKLFIAVSAVFAMGHFGYAFLLLKARNIGLADSRAILLYVLFYVVYTVCTIPAGMLSDKIGRKPLIMAGYLMFAVVSLGLVFTAGPSGIVLFFILYGVFYSMIDGVQRAFVVDLAPAHLKATALGAFHTAIGLTALPGGYIAGSLWDKIDPKATFGFGFILTAVALTLFIFIREGSRVAKS